MKEADRFRAANMLRDDVPAFEHGRHIGLEFWMNEQEFDYYREHLLLHEATHCFLTAVPGMTFPCGTTREWPSCLDVIERMWMGKGRLQFFLIPRRGSMGLDGSVLSLTRFLLDGRCQRMKRPAWEIRTLRRLPSGPTRGVGRCARFSTSIRPIGTVSMNWHAAALNRDS